MDTTETFIKMRLAAIPDLGLGVPMDVFFRASINPSNTVFVDGKGNLYTLTEEEPYYCQLERQDQLQEMVDGGFVMFWQEFLKYEYYEKPVYMNEISDDSMEQLLLAFVQHELHNKVWTGTEWKGDNDGKESNQEATTSEATSSEVYATGNEV